MPIVEIAPSYEPLPAQAAFHRSKAKFCGYGGAMGGGKSRALCEEAFQAALEYPGIEIVIGRSEHTAISDTTRKTMFREVLPSELVKHCRVIKSGGFDFIEFPNGSVINFVGTNDPIKFMSGEFGLLILDEAHEIDEDTMLLLNTRLRQKCGDCRESGAKTCNHLPRKVLLGFNPENPGHWLWRMFFQDAEPTKWGQYKREVLLDEDAQSLGDAEFVKAKAVDNPYLPEGYVQRELGGMKEFQRQRYLEGEWVFLNGMCIFDQLALSEYGRESPEPLYRFGFDPVGIGDRARRKKSKEGYIRVFSEPDSAHTYAIGVDTSSGYGADFSCAYVVSLSSMEFVAELHDKLPADEFAEQLHFLGKWYGRASECASDSLIAVESAGGHGEPVIIGLRDGKDGRPAYGNLYRHRLDSHVNLPTAQRFGYPMNKLTRPQVLGELGEAIRERSLPFLPHGLTVECHTFCEFDKGTPRQRAQDGCHDDRVMAAAITLELYRQRGSHPEREMRLTEQSKIRRQVKALMERDPFWHPPKGRRSRQLYPPLGRK